MTLLNPAALIFAVLVPLIVVLYLLKLRRQPARVSTLMFWQRVTADNRRRALFQRLRQVLSLLLHLLIFGLLLFALARPELRAFRGVEAGLSTVVVLDARARMQAHAGRGGETRFEQARRMAESYLHRASPRQPVALLVAESAPRVLVGLTSEERSLLAGLDEVRPTDAGGRIEDSVDLARGLLASRAGGQRIIVVTDRAPANAAGSPEVETRLVPGATGEPRENVGVTRLTARALPNSPETDEVLVEVQNFGARRQTGSVELSFEGQLFDVKPYDLAPGEQRLDVYPALAARSGVANARGWLMAHLAPAAGTNDAYPLDDDAYAVVPPPRPARVLLVTAGNWILENLLKADDRVQFDQLAPDAFQPAQATAFDAVILDDFLPAGFDPGGDPAKLPPGNWLFLKRLPFAGVGAGESKPLEHPIITDTDAASALLRLVDLRDATILRAWDWTLPEPAPDADGANPWRFAAPVRSFEHPLVLTGERRGQRLAALAFGVADSDLPLRVAFPLLMHNALQWLTGRDDVADAAAASVRAGETISLSAGETLWTKPQRTYQPINGPIPTAERLVGPAVFQPQEVGFYLVHGADGADRWVAVNTLDAEMSALNGAAGPAGLTTPAARPALAGWWETARVWPPWVYLACIAFALCTLEWWGFHRRRTE